MPSVQPPNHESELSRLRSGDEPFFHAVFSENYETLVDVAEGIVRSRAVAEEIAQEAFLYLWRQRDSVQIRGTVRLYLIGVVRNKSVSYVRHDRLSNSNDDESDWMSMPPIPADEAVSGAEFDAALRRAIMSLPERCRETFLLHRRQNLTYAEVAEVMGTSVKTVKTQIARALAALRSSLEKHL